MVYILTTYLGVGVIAGLQLRFRQVIAGTELVGFLRRGGLEQGQRFGGILLAQQDDAAV